MRGESVPVLEQREFLLGADYTTASTKGFYVFSQSGLQHSFVFFQALMKSRTPGGNVNFDTLLSNKVLLVVQQEVGILGTGARCQINTGDTAMGADQQNALLENQTACEQRQSPSQRVFRLERTVRNSTARIAAGGTNQTPPRQPLMWNASTTTRGP